MTQTNTAQIIEIPTQNPGKSLEKHLGGFWGAFGGAENHQPDPELSENDNNHHAANMRNKILHKLEQADLRNKKGKDNALKLISSDNGIRLIHDTAQASNGNRDQYVDGLLALIEQYDCGACLFSPCYLRRCLPRRTQCKHAGKAPVAGDDQAGYCAETFREIQPLGSGENIGKHENALIRKARILFDVSDERLELRRQQIKAQDEARLLVIAKKQAILAQKRKQLVMTAANAAGEAARITETLPEDQSAGAFLKNNLMPLVVVALFGVVIIGGLLSGEDTSSNTPAQQNIEWATMGSTGQQPVNPLQQPLTTPATAYESVWSAPEEGEEGEDTGETAMNSEAQQ